MKRTPPSPDAPDLGTNTKSTSTASQASQTRNGPAEISPTQRKIDEFEDRILNPMESGVFTFGKQCSSDKIETIESTVRKLADEAAANIDLDAIENSVRGFAEGSRVLMNALDEVAKLHPFIAVAALAFKAVVSLELKRRENDRKVIALHLEMQNMMSMLLELHNVKDPNQPSPDGTTIQGRMQRLMKEIAKDIKACGNVCDTYTKKNLIVKVLKGPIYEGRLADFAVVFTDRRKEIELALQIHTTLGVDSANRTLADVQQDVRSMDQKLSMILQFRTLQSPQEKELSDQIALKGGVKTCLANDSILKELLVGHSKDFDSTPPSLLESGGQFRSQVLDASFNRLRIELRQDVAEHLAKNMSVFERKLEIQTKQLVTELSGVVRREGDRVISAVISGPHDRVLDPHLHAIWVEMGWKGSVKARHVALALNDYFVEMFRDADRQEFGHYGEAPSPAPSSISLENEDIRGELASALSVNRTKGGDDDRWVLTYINISRTQPLLEALDDDASGFVSVKEINKFTTSRPMYWSLPHWVAYWSAGWHSSVSGYYMKICGILTKMFDVAKKVLPPNRALVDTYLADPSFISLDYLLRSVNVANFDPELDQRMLRYVREEELRIENNLRAVNYEIDAANTLSLITGSGRIERYIFPLLFILLRRHLRIIKLARRMSLHKNELVVANQSVSQLFDAARDRIDTLSVIFKNKNIDVTAQFSNVGFGMLQFLSDTKRYKDRSEGNNLFGWFEDDGQEIETDASILKYGPYDEFNINSFDESSVPANLSVSTSTFATCIVGRWAGHCFFYDSTTETEGLMDLTIDDCALDGQFYGRGFEGMNGGFTVHGQLQCTRTSTFDVTFTKEYPPETELLTKFCAAVLDTKFQSIEGHWGYDPGDLHSVIIIRQTPANLHRFRHSREQWLENPIRARWAFARDAVRHQARQRLWSWQLMKESIAERRRFVSLFVRRDLGWTFFNPDQDLSDSERDELMDLERNICPKDNRLFRLIGQSQVRQACVHIGSYCASCHYVMRPFRCICLQCTSKNYADQIDLCRRCITASVNDNGFVHQPNHILIKTQRIVHDREKPSLILSSWTAVHRAKAIFPLARTADQNGESLTDGESGPRSDHLDAFGVVTPPNPICSCCHEAITPPCWICVTCDEDILICDKCDITEQPCLNPRVQHGDEHPLVHYQHTAADDESDLKALEAKLTSLGSNLNGRLSALEKRFAEHEGLLEDRFKRLEKRFDDHEVAMATRLKGMEDLLRTIATRMIR